MCDDSDREKKTETEESLLGDEKEIALLKDEQTLVASKQNHENSVCHINKERIRIRQERVILCNKCEETVLQNEYEETVLYNEYEKCAQFDEYEETVLHNGQEKSVLLDEHAKTVLNCEYEKCVPVDEHEETVVHSESETVLHTKCEKSVLLEDNEGTVLMTKERENLIISVFDGEQNLIVLKDVQEKNELKKIQCNNVLKYDEVDKKTAEDLKDVLLFENAAPCVIPVNDNLLLSFPDKLIADNPLADDLESNIGASGYSALFKMDLSPFVVCNSIWSFDNVTTTPDKVGYCFCECENNCLCNTAVAKVCKVCATENGFVNDSDSRIEGADGGGEVIDFHYCDCSRPNFDRDNNTDCSNDDNGRGSGVDDGDDVDIVEDHDVNVCNRNDDNGNDDNKDYGDVGVGSRGTDDIDNDDGSDDDDVRDYDNDDDDDNDDGGGGGGDHDEDGDNDDVGDGDYCDDDEDNEEDDGPSARRNVYLSCLSLNVCGVRSKLLYPEFVDYISQYDVICLLESKLADTDEIHIDGFTMFYKNRDKYKHKSGGILVMLKDCYVKYVTIFEESCFKSRVNSDVMEKYQFVNFELCNNVLFFKLNEESCDSELLFCATYLEPEGSPYCNRNAFNEIENAIINLGIENICVLGDLNSRIGHVNETLITNTFTDDDDSDDCFVPRVSQDNVINNMGNELISFCRTSDMLIVNGRVGTDAGVGRTTCKNVSVVDYAIVSKDLFHCIHDFAVMDFNEILSDVHCPIVIHFQLMRNTILHDRIQTDLNNDSSECFNTYVKWDDKVQDEFVNTLNKPLVTNIEQNLDLLLRNSIDVNQNNIDEIVSKVNAVLLDSAQKVGMVKKTKIKKRTYLKKNNKAWFNDTCKLKRKQFLKAKKRANANKDNLVLKIERKRLAKEYKKCVRKQYRKYNSEIVNSLRRLKSNDPKSYWNIFNKQKKKSFDKTPSCDVFLDMFKNLNDINTEETENAEVEDREEENAFLNQTITKEEVMKCLKKLKKNKACGLDNIVNEFLKSSSDVIIEVLVKLFNLVLLTGVVPKDWTDGVIKPIFKKKGSVDDPNNYRGITILSCLGKLFTSVLNDRLNNYIEEFNVLGFEQAGFRNGFSTLDHLFTLHGMIDILLYKKKRLYCAFLDYEKAFDKINRAFLWEKLLASGVNGKVLNVIRNMYSNAKSCVMVDGECSNEFFCSNLGVRQGENLSPVLFALFLNDMKEFLASDMNGLTDIAKEAKGVHMSEEEIEKMLNLFVLLYADDTVIFSDSINGLQVGLEKIKQYCERWKLFLNVNKCKIMIFSRGKVRNRPDFFIGLEKIEIVDNFLYLGLKLNYNNKMHVAQRDLYDRASRAMFSLMKKAKECMLPVDLTIDLFEKTVVPVLTYACEIWGYDMIDIVNKLQLKFFKFVLKLRPSTPSMMVYGETGKFPISVHVKSRMLCFWFRLCCGLSSNKLSSLVYKCLHNLYLFDKHRNTYLLTIENILNELGLSGFWLNQRNLNFNAIWFKEKIKLSLQDQFIQQWYVHVDNDEVFLNYRMYKNVFNQDSYFSLLPQDCVYALVKFRTTNNVLPVNKLRFTGIIRVERLCTKCDMNEVGDEFHYLFVCPHFSDDRKHFLSKFYYVRPSAYKFNALLSTNKKNVLLKLKHFVNVIERGLR